MTRKHEIELKNATLIAEQKVRQARAMQANEARDMAVQALKVLVLKFRRNKRKAHQNAMHGTRLNTAGLDAKTIQTRLGHEDIAITLQFYVHADDGNARKAADVFEGLGG